MNMFTINAKSSKRIELGDISGFDVSFQGQNVYTPNATLFCVVRSGENVVFDGLFVDFIIYHNFLLLKKYPEKVNIMYNLQSGMLQTMSYDFNSWLYTNVFCRMTENIIDCSIEFRSENYFEVEKAGCISILPILPDFSKPTLSSSIHCLEIYQTLTTDFVPNVELDDISDYVAFNIASFYHPMRIILMNEGMRNQCLFYKDIYADCYIDSSLLDVRCYDNELGVFPATIVVNGNISKLSFSVDRNALAGLHSVVSYYKKKFK